MPFLALCAWAWVFIALLRVRTWWARAVVMTIGAIFMAVFRAVYEMGLFY